MVLNRYFVLVRDINNSREYIYNNQPVTKEKAQELFKDFIEFQQSDYLYDIHDNFCELYKETTEIEKGWIWNGETKSRTVDFILTIIELHEFFKSTGPESNDIAIQCQCQCESESESESDNVSMSTTCTFTSSYKPTYWFDWNATFQKELIEKLASPNLGLKHVKYSSI